MAEQQDRDDMLSEGTSVRPMDQIGRQDEKASDDIAGNGDDVVGRAEDDDEFVDDDEDMDDEDDLDAADDDTDDEPAS